MDKPEAVGDSVKAEYDNVTKTVKITLTNLNYVTTSSMGMFIYPSVKSPAAEKIDITLVGNNYIEAKGSQYYTCTGLNICARYSSEYVALPVLIHGDVSNADVPTLKVVSQGASVTASSLASSTAITIMSGKLTIRDCELNGESGDVDVEFTGQTHQMTAHSRGIIINSDKDVQMENCKITGTAGKSSAVSSATYSTQPHPVEAYSFGVNLQSADGIDIKKSEISGTSSLVTLTENKDNGGCHGESCGIKTTKCTFTDCKISATSGKVIEGGSATPTYSSLVLHSIGFYGTGDVVMKGTTCNSYGNEVVPRSGQAFIISASMYGSSKMEFLSGSTISTKSADGVKAEYGIIGTKTTENAETEQLLRIDKSDVTSVGKQKCIINISDTVATATDFTNVGECMKIVDSSGNPVDKTKISEKTEIHIVNNYKVTYKHGDHATGVDVTETAAYLVDYTISENMFTPETGWTFDHWTDGTKDYKPGVKITNTEKKEEITLTAVCLSDNVTVTFDSDGGSPVDSQTVMKGQCASKPADPTKSGYNFLGWYVGDTLYNFSTPVTSDITLKAKWEKAAETVTVTFMSDGAEYASQTFEKGGKAIESQITKEGYVFLGWYNGELLWNFDTPVNANMTLTAKWTKVQEQITVDTDAKGNAEVIVPVGANVKSLTIENTLMNIVLPEETVKALQGKTLYVSIKSANSYTLNQIRDGNAVSNAEEVFEVVMKVGNEDFKGKTTFQIPFESKKTTNPSVYIRTASGDKLIKSTLSQEGIISFDAEQGGTYVVKYTVSPQPTTDNNSVIVWTVLLIVLGSVGCLVAYVIVKSN